MLSQREIDIISNTQQWREEGAAAKRIPQCTFLGGERRTRRLNSALAILKEVEVEDVPYLYNQRATKLRGAGGYSRMEPILIPSICLWFE